MSYLQEKPFQFWIMVAALTFCFILLFKSVLMPFVVGITLAYMLNPIVEKLTKRKLPRWLSAFFILAIFFVITLIAVLFAVPVLIREMIEFVQLMPSLFQKGEVWLATNLPMVEIPQSLDDINKEALSEKAGDILNIGKDVLGNVLKGGMAIIGFISAFILIPIIAFYLMIDWPRLTAKIQDLVPEGNKKTVTGILSDIDKSLSGFIRGQLSVCFLLGLFYAIGLSVIGLQYGFFIGVASGILSIIPFVGSLFGLVASVGMAFYQFGGWEYPLIAFIIFATGQLIEGNYLTPKLVGESVGLHPIWVIFVLMAGGALLGLLGMIIAVPVAAIIAVLLRHAISQYKQSTYYKGR
jgi:predicted PurR-regulated permease PerM